MKSARAFGLPLALGAGLVFIALLYADSRPLEHWLFFRLLGIWAALALFALAVASVGNRIVSTLLGDQLPTGEHWVLSAAAGLLAFFIAAFVAGLLHLYRAPYFSLLPLALIALGWKQLVERLARTRATPMALTAFEIAAMAFTLVCVIAVALPVLDPANLSFDAQWYHLPVAEHYAAAHGVVRFPDGPSVAVKPPLLSMIDAWAVQYPFGGLWDRLVLAGHLEVLVVAATLAALPVLCRVIAPAPQRWTAAVAVLFFFPSIFVYDTGLQGGADHWAAFLALCAWIALLRFWPRLDLRTGLLFALPMSAMCLTKFTVAPAAAVMFGALVVRAVQLRQWKGLGAFVAAGIVLTTPLWLKNWVWYGAPLYPLATGPFSPHPWTEDTAQWLRIFASTNFVPQGTFGWETVQTLRALYDFSYAPKYAWPTFHTTTPAFGSAFTATLLALPFLAAGRRMWALVAAIHGGVALWYVSSHQERYLLVLVPWMAAVLAVTVVLAWKQGSRPVRALVVAILAVQLVGAADLPFFPSHTMTWQSPLARVADFLGQGYRGHFAERFETHARWETIGAAVPRDGVVLLHKTFTSLGLQRRRVDDLIPHQFGVNWGRLGSLAGVHRKLKELGVTHVYWDDAHARDPDSVAGELLFHSYVAMHVAPRAYGSARMGALSDVTPLPHGDLVQYVGCGRTYATGLYRLSQLTVPPAVNGPPAYPAPAEAGLHVDRAQFVVIETACGPGTELTGFATVGNLTALGLALFVRG